MLRRFASRFRQLVASRRLADEFDEELLLHLELEIEHNVTRGMSPSDARRAAIAAFGGVQRFREETRDARGFAAVEALVRDVRLALRRMRRAPAFATGVVATLGIGLGAATGIGALVYGVMLRPLPYPDPDRLVRVSVSTPGLGIATTENSAGTFVFFRERARSFADLGAYLENEGISITDGAAPERVVGAILTPNLLRLLGTTPALGRLFRDDDARRQPVPVLISYDLWQRRFGGDSTIVGKSIELNRSRREILGVLPRAYDFPSRVTSVYYPEEVTATTAGLRNRYLTVVGRLRAGVSVRDAQSELSALASHFGERFPELSSAAIQQMRLRPVVETLRDATIAPVRGELTLLGIMVVVVLLIATANVATLHLLRAERLRGEIAVARALGASDASLVQRFVVEGCLLSIFGAITGIPIVVVAISTKFGFTPGQIPRLHAVELTPAVVGGLGVVAVGIGVMLGLLGVARGRSGAAIQTLRGESRVTGAGHWRRLQETLVCAQIALALALLLGAGLMAESLSRLHRVDIGFSARDGSTFAVHLPFNGYPNYQRAAAFDLGLLQSLSEIPGVTAAAASMEFPLTPQLLSTHPRLEVAGSGGPVTQSTVHENVVSANFFGVMGIPMRAGRSFTAGDLRGAAPSVIISASVAHDLFGDADAVGRTVRVASSRASLMYRVVGVVGDVYADRIADGVLRELYYPLLDDFAATSSDTAHVPDIPAGMHFVVQSEQPLSVLLPSIRRAVAVLDPRVPVWGVRTLGDIVAESTARMRLTMLLLLVAAAATLLLGAVGLYSVIAYAVAGRSSEFALRLAIGATPAEIIALVLREGVLLAALGAASGIALSLASTRLVRGLLYDVSATDPVIYAAAAVTVVGASVAAMYLPARRAGNADPASALRGV